MADSKKTPLDSESSLWANIFMETLHRSMCKFFIPSHN